MAKSKSEIQSNLKAPVIAIIPEDDDDLSIDDLLGDTPLPTLQEVRKRKAAKEGKEPKEKVKKEPIDRSLKGTMVAFRTKDGKVVVGMGVLYYVARMDGKLHYKEASQVTILPDDWIPEKTDELL